MAYRIIIEAETKELALALGLQIVNKTGANPTAIQFNNEEPIPWDTVKAIAELKANK